MSGLPSLVVPSPRIRSVFVPDAVVHTLMEPSMRTARAQELRWEGGHFALARRHVGPLLVAAARRRSWTLLDAALDLATPPLALLIAGTAAMTAFRVVAALEGAPVLPAGLWALLLAGQAWHVFAGCALARVPARAYAALFLYGRAYALAKAWYYVLIVTGGARDWVPTPRKAPAVGRAA